MATAVVNYKSDTEDTFPSFILVQEQQKRGSARALESFELSF